MTPLEEMGSGSSVELIVTFIDETGKQEDQEITVRKHPTKEWLCAFMYDQGFTKVAIREIKTEMKTFGLPGVIEREYEA